MESESSNRSKFLTHGTPTESQVKIGRLRKRIGRLTKQRDHWKAEYESLSAFFKIYPYIDRHRDEHTKKQADRQRLRELEATQAILVRELERLKAVRLESPKETPPPGVTS